MEKSQKDNGWSMCREVGCTFYSELSNVKNTTTANHWKNIYEALQKLWMAAWIREL